MGLDLTIPNNVMLRIQSSAAEEIDRDVTAYWIVRRSLSSGRPKAGPGGGR